MYIVPESCMQIISCICRKGCFGLCSDKNHGLHYPGAYSSIMGNYGNQLKANRTALMQTFNNFEIKIMSSFKKNGARFQASILYKFCLCTE